MKELLDHLDRIARANNDTFSYSIDIINNKKGIKYQFVAKEVYDDHIFICSEISGSVVDFTIDKEDIKRACGYWNYTYVD